MNFLNKPNMNKWTWSILLCYYLTFDDRTKFYISNCETPSPLKGCGMGPWLVLVSPCFRENIVVTCKIGSFLCNLDNLLQKNVIVFFFFFFFFWNQISKWRSFEKRAIFDLLFTFLVTREKLRKFLQHISHSHPRLFYFAFPSLKKNTNLSGTVSLWYES